MLLLLPACGLHAQALHGTVLHDSLTTPMPFASVGVRNKPFGTVTDAQGRFSFPDSPELTSQDTVVVSCVGYWPVRVPLPALRQQHAALMKLRPRAQALREVTVRHRQLRPEVLGHSGKSGMARWGISSMSQDSTGPRDMRGREFGTFLRPARSCYVDSFNVYIESNPFRAVRFRLMLYAVRDGKPATALLPDDVQFVVRDQRTGWISVDLRSYNLQLEKKQPVALALQWLDNDTPSAERWFFGIPAVFPAPLHRVFSRNKSQAQWTTFPMQPSMYLKVQSWQE
ncbi:carboxypeptidase-like regulatory domain-containing protein [Hymenobacter sublimis]|uniref:Carboxypeptidase-like regulatory domain-containing protein n=1 Tax=Hymenobacter sublimis TaxID=2933777 RepID=A0ABY4JDD2_9BACT|nr:carboxypeptidase-like regulatory domain-containing protein [Hymenobacter sublimis]UPL50810.1 carboxypeptidase-like regulatory domain-containing protein [Hymenobacter sublimis]